MKKFVLLIICFAFLIGQSYAQTYELDFSTFNTGTQFDDQVNAMDFDSDGKLLVGGEFTDYNGTARNFLARLNADGTIDAGYNPSPLSSVTDLAVHADNSVTILSSSSTLIRYNANGTDVGIGAFFPQPPGGGFINVVTAEPTGSDIIIGGVFTGGISKLLADGSVDAAFATNIGTGFNVNFGASRQVRSVEITNTGQILVGGGFTSFNGVTRNNIALLNSDGTLDMSFNPGTTLTTDVLALAMQDDGKALAGSSANSATRLVRMNADGSLDTGFSGFIVGGGSSLVRDIHVDGTNDIIVGGWFTQGLAMLDYTDGTVIDIAAGRGAEGPSLEVNAIAVPAGAIIIGGSFTTYNGTPAGNFGLVATCNVSIDTQPDNVLACETNNATFTVVATGGATYQWQENTTFGVGEYFNVIDGSVYSGTNGATLTLTGVITSMNNYRYRCIVSDVDAVAPTDCFTISEARVLNVNTIQVFSVDPANVTICEGLNTSFFVSVAGSFGGYQWQEDPGTGTFTDIVAGGVYGNVTNNLLSLSGVTLDMSGYQYRLKSTLCDPAGLFSAPATLTVDEAPVITQNPVNAAICVSGNASYSVTATSSNPITYQWQYTTTGSSTSSYFDLADNATYSGVTTPALSITNADNNLPELYDNTGDVVSARFRCVVTSNGCIVFSSAPILSIHVEPTVTTQPSDYIQCVNAGGTSGTTFSPNLDINPSGMPFQWEYDDGTGSFVPISDGAVYSGTNTRFLTLAGANTAFNGLYRLEVGACTATVYTDAATFRLDERPVLTAVTATIIDICEGSDAEFEISSSNDQVTYQWQRRVGSSFVDISDDATFTGATSEFLQISGATTTLNNNRFRCVTTNESCETNSLQFTLRVRATPSLFGTVTDRTVCDGVNSVSFTRPASGFNPLVHTYQWQEAFAGSDIFVDINDGAQFSGTNGTTLNVLAPTFSMNGNRYRQTVNGCVVDVVSDDALLTVKRQPIISASPEPQTVCFGEPISFSVSAIADEDVTYQWMVSSDGGANFSGLSAFGFSGRNTSTITDANGVNNSAINGWIFKCIVSAATPCQVLTAESLEATLTVNEVTLVTQSNNVALCAGETATFTVQTQGESLTYEWLEDGVPIVGGGAYSGVASPTLTILADISMSGRNYACRISGLCDNVISLNRNLFVGEVAKPEIFPDLTNTNGPTLFVTNVTGSSYQWFLDGSSLGFGLSRSISTAGSYTVIGTLDVGGLNDCVSEESDPYVYSGPLGLEDGFEVQIYPNPTQQFLKIDSEKRLTVQVFSLDGKVVLKDEIRRNETLDLAFLNAGQYIIHLLDADNLVYTGKIIKTN